MRAYEQFYRQPERDTLRTAFEARHGAMVRRYGHGVMKWSYRLHLARVGVDPTVIIERDGVIFRRVA